mmetsp:Transcript_81091/g.188397  ORF Transcript_81091/g.188397 Transcript_81091/m.188397 type:complete len:264 (+) Transcript_81091:354-1145(+)
MCSAKRTSREVGLGAARPQLRPQGLGRARAFGEEPGHFLKPGLTAATPKCMLGAECVRKAAPWPGDAAQCRKVWRTMSGLGRPKRGPLRVSARGPSFEVLGSGCCSTGGELRLSGRVSSSGSKPASSSPSAPSAPSECARFFPVAHLLSVALAGTPGETRGVAGTSGNHRRTVTLAGSPGEANGVANERSQPLTMALAGTPGEGSGVEDGTSSKISGSPGQNATRRCSGSGSTRGSLRCRLSASEITACNWSARESIGRCTTT